MRSSVRSVQFTLALLALLAAPLFAHVVLRSSAPGADEVVSTPPSHIRVSFSGRVESSYSELSLIAPDGAGVPLGPIMFTDGSDREFSALVPRLDQPGRYTIRWRTAGADGHVLQGSFSFVFAPDTDTTGVPTALPEPEPHDHEHGVEQTAELDLLAVLARWLHFLALLLLIGATSFRTLLLPRTTLADAVKTQLQRRSWRLVGVATLLLAASALLRLWLQSRALHGSDYAWDSGLLSILLADTSWGRAWLLQALGVAVVAVAMLLARPGRDAAAVGPLVITVIALASVPALSGHAVGAANPALAVANDTLHVLTAGAWLGCLAVIAMAALPALAGRAESAAGDVAHLIDRFSPIALGAAALVFTTGVLNSIMYIGSVAHLTTTPYGRVLLLKLAVVAFVVAAGFYNWRSVRPRLGTVDATRRLRISIAAEVTLAVIVLGVTALLTGLHRP